jgi:rod shape-determining protein MreB
MLRGLDKEFSQKQIYRIYHTGPLEAVVRGTGVALKTSSKFKSILIK